MPARPVSLVLFLTATLAAFGGIYRWALAPILIGALLLAATAPRLRQSDTRALDTAMVIFLFAVMLQLVPLPAFIRGALSPRAAAVEQMLQVDAPVSAAGAAPLTLNPRATLDGVALLLAVTFTYLAARRILSQGGVRLVCHATSVVASVAAVGAIVQRAATPQLIYGVWDPGVAGAMPFGTVVNRNHFAGWLLMASALTAGYLIARISRRAQVTPGWRAWRRMVVSLSQSTVTVTAALWLTTAVTVVAAQSRSAVAGLVVALAALLRSVTRRWEPVFLASAVALVLVVALLAAGEPMVLTMADRVAGTLASSEISRAAIWRETLPVVADFPLTGVGVGAYGRAMLVYQQTRVFVPHLGTEWHFNHAHNHYLHLAAEGGLLLLVPFGVVVVLFVRLTLRRLRQETGELRAVRLGAIAGLVGIATQSLWEVPLTMPAAALLAATLAAIATYRRQSV